MSKDEKQARISYLMNNSKKSVEEILRDGEEFERFVKHEAHLHSVPHLKDVLHQMKQTFGLVDTHCNHIQTDRDELERDVVMYDLRSFIYTDKIGTDNYILDKEYALLDSDLVRKIGRVTTGVDTSALQEVLSEKQIGADVEVDKIPLKRADILKKLSLYMDYEEACECFKSKEPYFHESIYELCQADLIMYLHSALAAERLDLLPDLFAMSRNHILDTLEGFLTTDELLGFEAYAKRTSEDERKSESEGYRDIFSEDEEDEKPTVSDVKRENEKYKRFMRNQKEKEAASVNVVDDGRFKYVLKNIISSQLPRNTRENLSPEIKRVFGSLGAHELTSLDTLHTAHDKLISKYPHAEMIIDGILSDVRRGFLFGRREIRIRPTLLVGDPGNGKSSLARDIMEAFDVHVTTVNVGGMSETNILGVSSGYSSAMPSMITTAVGTSRRINPTIILDEIDKSSRGSMNGDISAGLLSLLEPSENSKWYEKSLNLHVDASYINWVLTANDMNHVPLPLVSRCTVYKMDNPGVEHVETIVRSIIANYAVEMGVDPRFFQLSASDMDYLKKTMPKHRSVRILKGLTQMLLDEKEALTYNA